MDESEKASIEVSSHALKVAFISMPFQLQSARATLAWGNSDHMAIIRAFNGWRDAEGWSAKRSFADAHGLR